MENNHGWTLPHWAYMNKRPTTDDAYFENLTRVIFTAGLNWNTIDVKWVGFRKAFSNFIIGKVAKLTEKDLEKLMADPEIVRNRAKIIATVFNAKQMLSLRGEFGSFQKYLDSLDKSDNYSQVISDLERRFKHVGKSTAEIFLWSVGEKIEPQW